MIDQCRLIRHSDQLLFLCRSIGCLNGLYVWFAGGRGRKKRLQKANAFVIYMLGEFVEACEAKQVRDRNEETAMELIILLGFGDFLGTYCMNVFDEFR